MINNAAAGQDRFLSLEVFSASWALCLVLSKLSRTALDTPWAAATFAVAVVAMLRPREPRWLVAAAVARLVEYATDLPDNTQHFYLNAAFALAVVVGYAASAFRLRTLMPAPQRLFEALAPGVRMIAITCLFWAGAAKLNTDFLDPELSCASQLYDYQRYYVPLLPDADWARSAAPFLAIVGELGAALLLVFRPTRALGIAVGLAFMLTVGLNPHNRVFVFAGPVMAALCTFVSESVWARIARSIALVRWVQPVVRGAASAPFFWLCVVFFGTLAWWGEPRGALRAFREETIIVIFKVGGPVFLTILASAFWSLRRSGGILATPLVGHRPGWAFWVGVAVFAHQALMIAGLNSKAHFNMASNFSVSPAFSSHLLFRAPHWGFNEPVRLLDSSSKRLKRLRSDRRGFPWLYFSDLVARYPNASVRYSVGNSEAVRISRVGDHPELFRSSVYAWAFKGYPVPLKRQTLRCSHIAPQNRKSRRTGRRSKHR